MRWVLCLLLAGCGYKPIHTFSGQNLPLTDNTNVSGTIKVRGNSIIEQHLTVNNKSVQYKHTPCSISIPAPKSKNGLLKQLFAGGSVSLV